MNEQDEVLIVVDDQDNVVDYLPRKSVHEKHLLHRTISITVYNDHNQVLLQKRSIKKDSNAGKWSNATGGHVNKGSEYEQTARMEIQEELGINPKLILIKKMKINDPAETTMTSIYKTVSNGPFNFNKQEIDEVRFFSKQDLAQMQDQLSGSAKIVLNLQGMIE